MSPILLIPESDFFRLLEPQFYKTAHFELLYRTHQIKEQLSSFESVSELSGAENTRFSRPRPSSTVFTPHMLGTAYGARPDSQSKKLHITND